METPLDQEVRKLLKTRLGDLRTLAKEAGVSYSWIVKFHNDKIPNPSYNALARLHSMLIGTSKARVIAAKKEQA